MRRAYPQSLTVERTPAAGRHSRQVIFPLGVLGLDPKHANTYDLDPYVMAALIAQESTFDPDIRSAANAWGLMQIVPATGRRLARTLGIRRFTTASLTNPQTNIRLGTLYFSRLVRQFGGTYYALASYNAGENRVVRWKAERPGHGRGRVHRRHPVPGDAELREADPRDRRGLPGAVWARMAGGRGASTRGDDSGSAARSKGLPVKKPAPAPPVKSRAQATVGAVSVNPYVIRPSDASSRR